MTVSRGLDDGCFGADGLIVATHSGRVLLWVNPYIFLQRNDACLDAETTQQQIESAFKTFTERSDVSVLLINQSVRRWWVVVLWSRRLCAGHSHFCPPLSQIALSIRHLLDEYTRPVPAILEIPSKDQPYDPSQDSILARVRFMFGDG